MFLDSKLGKDKYYTLIIKLSTVVVTLTLMFIDLLDWQLVPSSKYPARHRHLPAPAVSHSESLTVQSSLFVHGAPTAASHGKESILTSNTPKEKFWK